MKELLKNPMFYYVIVPCLIMVWPLLVGSKYMPKAENDLDKWIGRFSESQAKMLEILRLDPDRQQRAEKSGEAVEFSYPSAVHGAARACLIRSENLDLDTRIPSGAAGKKTQAASVSLEDVGIEKAANFIWKIQMNWPGLECTKIKLTHKSGTKDQWDIALEFKYYF